MGSPDCLVDTCRPRTFSVRSTKAFLWDSTCIGSFLSLSLILRTRDLAFQPRSNWKIGQIAFNWRPAHITRTDWPSIDISLPCGQPFRLGKAELMLYQCSVCGRTWKDAQGQLEHFNAHGGGNDFGASITSFSLLTWKFMVTVERSNSEYCRSHFLYLILPHWISQYVHGGWPRELPLVDPHYDEYWLWHTLLGRDVGALTAFVSLGSTPTLRFPKPFETLDIAEGRWEPSILRTFTSVDSQIDDSTTRTV